MLPVTATIIARNEEKVIGRCLESLSWANEILLIDGGSTDQTEAICKDPKAPWASVIRFVHRPWDGFRNQRNFSLKEAKNDWIFVLDADESCSEELRAKIQTLLSSENGPPHTAYKVRRKEFFLGKQIDYGVWNPSYQDRFFLKKGVQYVNDIHEYPVFPAPAQYLHEPILHDPHFNIDRFLDKMNKYTTIEAQDRVRQGQRTNVFRLFFAFPAMFFKNYFYYAAYKDGYHGFIISLMEGISRAVRHIKIWYYSRQ